MPSVAARRRVKVPQLDFRTDGAFAASGYVTIMVHESQSDVTAAITTNADSGNRLAVYFTDLHQALDETLA
jgi:hypothetical protein